MEITYDLWKFPPASVYNESANVLNMKLPTEK